jgi:predicted Zn-dependent protease
MNSHDADTEGRQEITVISRRALLTRGALAGVGIALAPAAALEALAPRTAEARGILPKPSVDDQKKVGREAAAQVLKQYRVLNDSRARAFDEIGRRLVAGLPAEDRNKWDYDFHVLDSKEVNAFALPGGPMFLFTGLWDILSTEDALAGVTGHEMTHVRKEHWAKAYQKQQERQLGLAALLAITRAGRTAQSIAGLADSAIGMKFSRTEEDEADAGGLDDMVAAGFNPQGMVELFRALEKASGGGGKGLGGDFLSDHPLTSTRIKNTQQRIAKLQNQGRRFPALTRLRTA